MASIEGLKLQLACAFSIAPEKDATTKRRTACDGFLVEQLDLALMSPNGIYSSSGFKIEMKVAEIE